MEDNASYIGLSEGLISQIEHNLQQCNENYSAFFSAVSSEFDKENLPDIYNYFLQKSLDANFLKFLVKEMDKVRDPKNLAALIDFILSKAAYAISNDDINNFVDVRVLCIKAISNYRDTKAIAPLLYCLNNKKEHYKIRLAAAEALGKIGDTNAVDSLIDVVSDEEEKSVYVRESAAVALGMIGDMRAVDPFLSILEAKKNFLDKFTFLKERVIEALGKIDFSSNKRVISVFKNALEDESPQVRLNAVESLMNSRCEEAAVLIKNMLFDYDEEVARSSVTALYNLLGTEALSEILNDENMPYYCKEEAKQILEGEKEDDE